MNIQDVESYYREKWEKSRREKIEFLGMTLFVLIAIAAWGVLTK
jgi:hypothetical protein